MCFCALSALIGETGHKNCIKNKKIKQKEKKKAVKTYQERIKEIRVDSDTNQTKAAAVIDVLQSYYSKQERGKKPFTVEQIIKICQHYGVSADYILGLPKGLKWPREPK